MFERLKLFMRKVGVTLGFIENVQKVTEHKKVNQGNGHFELVDVNKDLYKGFLDDWHTLDYRNSYGQPKQRKVMSMKMAKVSAQHMAKVTVNEGFTVNIDGESRKEAKELIESVLYHPHFKREFRRYIEYMFALSGMAVKVGYDSEYNIKAYFANADSFYSLSNDSENVDEALLVNSFQRGDDYYKLFEWNEWINGQYTISLELFKSGDKGSLGDKVALSSLYPNLQPKTIVSNVTRPTFVYFKPGIANNLDLTSPYGISIFENAKDTMKQLDYMFDFFFREFRNGQARISVPRSMVRTVVDEAGNTQQVFDPEENVYAGIGHDEDGVKNMTIELRANDIITSINFMLRIFATQIGLTAGTFTFDGTAVKTATEIVSQDSETYQTRNDHLSVLREGLKDLCLSIVEMHNNLAKYPSVNKQPIVFDRDDVEIDFDDSLFKDKDSELDYYIKLLGVKGISRKQFLMSFRNMTEEDATAELESINNEELFEMMAASTQESALLGETE